MQKEVTNDFQIAGQVNLKDNITEGETVNLKAEAQKAKGYLFRGDGLFQPGDDIGFELNSSEADAADIQTPWEHVQDKRPGKSSRYTSFATTLKSAKKFAEAIIEEQGKKVIKKSQVFKAVWDTLEQLQTQGVIRIYTSEDIKAKMSVHEEKLVRDNSKNIYKNMTKNDEVLIEGQIPGEILKLVK